MIHVFKTSVKTDEDIKRLQPMLDSLSANLTWNFDLEDCDNILRVKGSNVVPIEIINFLARLNFECQELE